MADRMAAQIWIGGKVERSRLQKLCDAINAQRVSVEWGDAPVTATPDNLMEFVGNKNGALRFCDVEACWGELDDLESALRSMRIPFDRHSEGKYEYDPEAVSFRPGAGVVSLITDSDGNPVVHAAQVREALNHLKADRNQKAVQLLEKLLPEIPPLEPFEIV